MSDALFNTGRFISLHGKVLNEDNIEKALNHCYNPSPLLKSKGEIKPPRKKRKSNKYTPEQIRFCQVGIIPNGLKRSQCYNIRSNYRTRYKKNASCVFNKIIEYSELTPEMLECVKSYMERHLK